MYFLIQIDTSRFAEFEISKFDISRVDCKSNLDISANFISLIKVLIQAVYDYG